MPLVIGYGNTLRSDDGVGPAIAQIVADWQLPEIVARSVTQLTPELVLEMTEADLVIFVDAGLVAELAVQKLVLPDPSETSLGHTCRPEYLLYLTQKLYQHLPSAYLILLPGVNFAFGETFSREVKAAIPEALKIIKQLAGIAHES